jgi:hypothetical protein
MFVVLRIIFLGNTLITVKIVLKQYIIPSD